MKVQISLALALLLPAAVAGAPARPSPAARPVVFLRGGDLWLAPASGGERRLTRGGGYRGLAADRGRVVVTQGRSGDLILFAGPDWRPRRLTREERFVGPPCWRAGTRELLIAREWDAEGGDDGLWRIDTGRRARRQVLEAAGADLSVSHLIRLSPSGARAAAGGILEGALTLRVRDLRSERRWWPLGERPLTGGSDFAWLGEERLLVAGAPVATDLVALGGTPPARAVAMPDAGVQLLDLRTASLAPWLYPKGTEVLRICRAPGLRDRYAIGLHRAHAHSSLPPMARRLELVDGATRARRALSIPAPVHIAGFSADGRALLFLMLRRVGEQDLADVVKLDLATGRRRIAARDASEAAWLSH